MTESRWTSAFLALLGIFLLIEVPHRNSTAGMLFQDLALDQAPRVKAFLLHMTILSISLGICILFIVKRSSWWRWFQGRTTHDGPLDIHVLTRSILLVMGTWLILDPFLDLVSEYRDWVIAPTSILDPLADQIYWLWHGSSILLGFLLCKLSGPLAQWFVKTRLSPSEPGPKQQDSTPGEQPPSTPGE